LSKLQHLTQLNMQMLCPIIPDTTRAKCLRWGTALALTALPFAVVSGPFEDLEKEVVQWANATPAFQGRNMRVAPLDNRIALQNCQQKLQFDQPFPVQPSVRVRCSQPQW
jgi:hypothetical protein